MNYKITSESSAREGGYLSLTTPFKKSEYWIMDNIMRDMKGCNHKVVETMNGLEVWRHSSELLFYTGQ